MGRPYDEHEWLDVLGKNRPSNGGVFTQEILDLAGPPPIPPYAGSQKIDHYAAIKRISLQADDRYVDALLKVKRIRESSGGRVELDNAAAEASFWEQVRDWAETLD